jgi:hypothetical protein
MDIDLLQACILKANNHGKSHGGDIAAKDCIRLQDSKQLMSSGVKNATTFFVAESPKMPRVWILL